MRVVKIPHQSWGCNKKGEIKWFDPLFYYWVAIPFFYCVTTQQF